MDPHYSGTDTALALGMIKLIIEENLTDKPFCVPIPERVYLVDQQQKLLRDSANDKR